MGKKTNTRMRKHTHTPEDMRLTYVVGEVANVQLVPLVRSGDAARASRARAARAAINDLRICSCVHCIFALTFGCVSGGDCVIESDAGCIGVGQASDFIN